MVEEWKKLEVDSICENFYEISNLGKIRKTKTGHIIKTWLSNSDIECCHLRLNDGRRKCFRIHRLVAKTFVTKGEGMEYVDHIDGNKLNNHADNLRWVVHPNIKNCNKDKRVLCVELNETFPSVTTCAESLHKKGIKVQASNISKCCNNAANTHSGYHFKYV